MLSDTEKLRAITAISTMLESFPQRPGGSGQGDFVRAFVDNVSSLPLSVIEDMARRFVRGQVTDRNNAFPPSAAEFHEAATKAYQPNLARERARQRIAETRALSARYQGPEHSEESKQKIAEMAREWQAEVAEKERQKKVQRWETNSADIKAKMDEIKAETGQYGSSVLLETLKEQDDFNRLKESLPQDRINEAAE